MCVSTAYSKVENGDKIAEMVTTVVQRDGELILTDIMGKTTAVKGILTFADLTRGILLIESSV
ncbi:MAG: CooT family nickel-binding protein [Coriobacteriales bacterium]|nr:CooT family nickel-binding protein [Coriobacteriales bacterium]